jgi:hypothetical protein
MFTEMMMSAGGGTPELIEDTFTESYSIEIKNGVFSWLFSGDVLSEYIFINGAMTAIATNASNHVSYDGTTFSISNASYGNKPIKVFKVN